MGREQITRQGRGRHTGVLINAIERAVLALRRGEIAAVTASWLMVKAGLNRKQADNALSYAKRKQLFHEANERGRYTAMPA